MRSIQGYTAVPDAAEKKPEPSGGDHASEKPAGTTNKEPSAAAAKGVADEGSGSDSDSLVE